MSSFYITLSSAASNDIYKENKPTCFRTVLPYDLHLHHNDYEVALLSFQYYGQKWGALSQDERTFTLKHFVLPTYDYVLTWNMMMSNEYWVEINGQKHYLPIGNYD